ncbi:MAG: C25 family cysteine peptidase, partial [Pyrinomonadaceae bacterium]
HQVSVAFNGVNIGSLTFGALEHPVRTFSIPRAQVLSGNNTITFTKTSTGEVCIVDYIKLTYPHAFKVDANSLKFNLRGSQTLRVDGFSAPAVRLIDYTDPLNVRITKPASESSAAGYAITVPLSESRSKAQRLLYAIPEGQFDQPAALSLNQPSTLNANSNVGSFLIIAHKNFIPNMAPLLTQRQGQGFATSIVDVDDVYDEFSYGKHGPQAMRDFLQYAATQWATPPRYIIFAGDASLDPRNYEGAGDFDFVPTKLVDATYNETASDDWLADFDDDGIANIPVGRLPFRTAADANLIVSKIVNFTPPQPQSAMLVADEDEFNIFGFAQTNDTFQSFLPASMTVQRLNRAPQPPGVPAQNLVKADIVNGFNQGRALVNYSGHGNVDVWTGASLFDSADALALNNTNNRLSFVVVMDCLNGYFQAPNLLSLSEAFLKAPNGGAVAAFASSGLTIAQGQHDMGRELYRQLYGASPIALGDAIKIAKGATFDIDVKRTWVFFGDPSIKIR